MEDIILGLKCLKCGSKFDDQPMFDGCPSCRTQDFTSNIMLEYNYEFLKGVISRELFETRRPGMWAGL